MTVDIAEVFITIGFSLLGSSGLILWHLKHESDNFDKTKEDFDDKKFVRKNKFDFMFYIVAGFICLTIKNIINEHIGVEGFTDHGLSCMSGLLGSFIIEGLFKLKRK